MTSFIVKQSFWENGGGTKLLGNDNKISYVGEKKVGGSLQLEIIKNSCYVYSRMKN